MDDGLGEFHGIHDIPSCPRDSGLFHGMGCGWMSGSITQQQQHLEQVSEVKDCIYSIFNKKRFIMIKTSQNLVKSTSILFRVTTNSFKKVNYQQFTLFPLRRQFTTTRPTTSTINRVQGKRPIRLRRGGNDLRFHGQPNAAYQLVSVRVKASGSSAHVSQQEFNQVMSALIRVNNPELVRLSLTTTTTTTESSC